MIRAAQKPLMAWTGVSPVVMDLLRLIFEGPIGNVRTGLFGLLDHGKREPWHPALELSANGHPIASGRKEQRIYILEWEEPGLV